MSTLMRFRGPGLNPWDVGLSWLPLLSPGIRIEERLEEDRYIMRAELPGIDAAKDVELSLDHGELRLQVTRKETNVDKGRTEFHYGTFYRTVTLPPGVRTDTLTATYTDGILEITALVGEPAPSAKTIPVTVGRTARK